MTHEDYIYLDTETTGLEKPEVIEVGWVSAEESRQGVTRFKPSSPISLGAMLTHGILEEDLRDCSAPDTALGYVPKAHFWIGHNIQFDWEALGAPAGITLIDMLPMARALLPKLDSHKLGVLYLHFFGASRRSLDFLKQSHGALFDSLLARLVLPELLALGGKTHLLCDEGMPELYSWIEELKVPKIMTFGKYKGMAIRDVPYGYVTWYRRQEDQDPYLLQAFRLAGK